MHRARARAAVADGKEADALRKRVPSLGPVIAPGAAGEAKPLPGAPPVAADPLLIVDAGARTSRLAPFSHQNVLANARSLAARLKVGTKDRIAVDAPLHDPLGLAAVHLALATGAALVIGRGATPSIELASASAKRRKVPTAELRCLPETQAIAARGPRDAEPRLLDGVEQRAGARGEIELRGPGLAPAYVDDPSASLKRFADGGWFRSGARSMRTKERKTR